MDDTKIYIKIIRRCCVQVRCLWVILTKKEVNKWLSWQFNNLDVRLVFRFAEAVVMRWLQKGFQCYRYSSLAMIRMCTPVCKSTSRSSFVAASWKQNNQLSIVDIIEVKRKKMYCCNDVTNNLRGDIDAY